MFEVVSVSFAFVFGLLARRLGLPPLVGFLAAGFALNMAGGSLGLPQESSEILHHISEIGVLLLLFTVGLKLNLRQIAQLHVVGAAVAHFGLSIALVAPLAMVFGLAPETALLLAIAMSFSSTVLSAKLLETRRELGAFHGRTTIGILVVQDILALGVLALWSGQTPNSLAFLLLALPFATGVFAKILDLVGHDELIVLLGMALALVVGGAGFQAMGLSPEIGALAMGLMLSSHPRAKEMASALWSIKEVFLVGFFLQIGLTGLPDWSALGFAVLTGFLLPVKGGLFFALLVGFRLRARTSFLAALSLTAYSEFGLIVVASLLPEFLVPMAIALSVSFVISAPLNRTAHALFARWEDWLERWQTKAVHPDEQPQSLGDAEVVIFGMGRTGAAAYARLENAGLRVIGLDADPFRTQQHREEGRHVLYADAEDSNFWRQIDLSGIRAAVLALNDIEAKLIATRNLRSGGMKGTIVSQAFHQDHQALLEEAGANSTYLTMTQAGISLADRTSEALLVETELEDAIEADAEMLAETTRGENFSPSPVNNPPPR